MKPLRKLKTDDGREYELKDTLGSDFKDVSQTVWK